MMKTKQQTDVGAQLQQAVLEQAMEASGELPAAGKKPNEKRSHLFKVGNRANPGGRPKGVGNKVTRTIREAVEKAAAECHPEGLAGWLIERAQGSIQDRQIFATMVNKALPLQVQANVDGGIKLELSWLGGRQIGATAAQIPEQRTQVLDLERDPGGKYRIKDQGTGSGEGDA